MIKCKHKWEVLRVTRKTGRTILQWCQRCGTLRGRKPAQQGWTYQRPTRIAPKKKKLPRMPPTMACMWVLYTTKGSVWGGNYVSLSEALEDATNAGVFSPKFSVARFDRVSGSTKTYTYATTQRPPYAGEEREPAVRRWVLYDEKGDVFGSDYLSRQEAWDDAMGPRFRPRFRVAAYEYAKGTKRHYKYKGQTRV